ncbi:MAG: DinB family protein [Mucilaginibacter sp.]|nr:DinB family protein [Mucilaginibacter sp.]
MIDRPQPDEYVSFHNTYISKVPGGDVLKLLGELKESTYELFSNMSEERANYAYDQDKWTLKQVLGHVIDTERTFAYRLLYFSRNFIELPGFDQDIYVNNANFNSRTIQSLASEFRATRESNLYLITALTDEQLNKKGVASSNKVSVRALVYIIAGHELHHLKIIKERYF